MTVPESIHTTSWPHVPRPQHPLPPLQLYHICQNNPRALLIQLSDLWTQMCLPEITAIVRGMDTFVGEVTVKNVFVFLAKWGLLEKERIFILW